MQRASILLVQHAVIVQVTLHSVGVDSIQVGLWGRLLVSVAICAITECRHDDTVLVRGLLLFWDRISACHAHHECAA